MAAGNVSTLDAGRRVHPVSISGEGISRRPGRAARGAGRLHDHADSLVTRSRQRGARKAVLSQFQTIKAPFTHMGGLKSRQNRQKKRLRTSQAAICDDYLIICFVNFDK